MTRLVIIGGSDAGISAGLRAREVDPGIEPLLIVADGYPNFSICGIPYLVSGEVTDWRNLAHRSRADLEAAGLQLRLDTRAQRIDPAARTVTVTGPSTAADRRCQRSQPGRWRSCTAQHGRHIRTAEHA